MLTFCISLLLFVSCLVTTSIFWERARTITSLVRLLSCSACRQHRIARHMKVVCTCACASCMITASRTDYAESYYAPHDLTAQSSFGYAISASGQARYATYVLALQSQCTQMFAASAHQWGTQQTGHVYMYVWNTVLSVYNISQTIGCPNYRE